MTEPESCCGHGITEEFEGRLSGSSAGFAGVVRRRKRRKRFLEERR
jgi:hypothetical protein